MDRHQQQFELHLKQKLHGSHPIPYEFGDAFMRCYGANNFNPALAGSIGGDAALRQMHRYHIGTVRNPEGGCIALLADTDNPFDGYSDGVIYLNSPQSGRSMAACVEYASDRLLELCNIDILSKARQNVFIGEHFAHSSPEKPVIITSPMITAVIGDYIIPQYSWVAIGEHRELLFRDPSLIQRLPSKNVCFLSDDMDTLEWTATIRQLLLSDTRIQLRHRHYAGDLTKAIVESPNLIEELILSTVKPITL